jgi:nucleoside-diphosphate-sugar epimerase
MGKMLRTVYLSPSLTSVGAGLLEAVYALIGKGTPALSRYRVQRACQSLAHDTTKARKELGWRPVASLPQGLTQSWQWWQNQGQSSLASVAL